MSITEQGAALESVTGREGAVLVGGVGAAAGAHSSRQTEFQP